MSTTRQRAPAWQHAAPARGVHASIALLCLAGLLSSLYLGWTEETSLPDGVGYSGGFSAGWEHMLNQPAYFTVVSALLVCLTSALMALRTRRSSQLFHSLRLAGVVQVIITGVVFNLLLRTDVPMTGVWLFNDRVLHVILPVLVPVVWLGLGPHGRINGRVVLGSTVIPLAWLAVTLIRGPVLDWYPYTILDVPGMGYAGVSVYVVAILLGFMGLACLLWLIDYALSRFRRGQARA
ncbi:Pr6Pr family membrane protein [Nesterenkonia muleiensis]|uniref:Pr6Pr family membrane protein n=1 Tax=Nesterenkonia muleiensis TaxID=2282648 RepID=UPI000E75728F|nr:Pr6Pr family membrane protein [Nesterenkonia muleiensis]